MPISAHPSFKRPSLSVPLWRYTDLSKFVDLLTSKRIWLANAEMLAKDDPHEGLPGPLQFPHRMWSSIEQVPDKLRKQIVQIYASDDGKSPESAFKQWFKLEEQRCHYSQAGRRNYYVNCWHAAAHESVAMWKIYGSPGAGVSIVTNGARLETALSQNAEELYLGEVQYWDPDIFEIGSGNAFDAFMIKRANFSYEQEVRLVHWDTDDMHNPLTNFEWNEETMRFDNIVEDSSPIKPGISLSIDVGVLIEKVVISPTAPSWYHPMLERLNTQLGYEFSIFPSKLLDPPRAIP